MSQAVADPIVTIPASLADVVAPSHDPAEIQKWGLEALVLAAFGENRLSTGEAAELLGMSYFEFLALVKERGIPLKITQEEFEQDQADLDKVAAELGLR